MILQTDHAARYANGLLKTFGLDQSISDPAISDLSDHPALAWRRSGLLQTTKLMLPSPLISHAEGVLLALKHISPNASELPQHGAVFLGERARLRETVREGRQCAGGYGRLLDTADGRIALNLVRDDDWVLIPAWLEADVQDWDGIVTEVRKHQADYLVSRAAELGLAVSKDELPERPSSWCSVTYFEQGDVPKRPLVVDLSGLWAGPLSTSLLGLTGCRVVKVEGRKRPDGMRLGNEDFYALINAGKECVALDFKDPQDFTCLKALLEDADVVIEASRPRAFQQLGIDAKDYVARKPGKVWARLTAYGREENRIGFGDDIGVAAGLTTLMARAHNEPCFVGDAIADPVNGLHLAFAMQAMLQMGGGAVIDISMRDCLRYAMGDTDSDLEEVSREWTKIAEADDAALYPMRRPVGAVKALGADSAVWAC